VAKVFIALNLLHSQIKRLLSNGFNTAAERYSPAQLSNVVRHTKTVG